MMRKKLVVAKKSELITFDSEHYSSIVEYIKDVIAHRDVINYTITPISRVGAYFTSASSIYTIITYRATILVR